MLRGIGAKLYVALGLAVLLTLLSSAVGVYYFETSGDLSHGVAQVYRPAYSDAWRASVAAARLQALGDAELARVLAGEHSGYDDQPVADRAGAVTAELRDALSRPGGLDGLGDMADGVLRASGEVTAALVALDELALVLGRAGERVGELRESLDSRSDVDPGALTALYGALATTDPARLDAHWERYEQRAARGELPDEVRLLAEGDDGVFAVQQSRLAALDRLGPARADFDARAAVLDDAAAGLLAAAAGRLDVALADSVASFDRGRVLLFGISAASVLIATLASWLWVGNMVVRRLSRLSERMRAMAGGDLDTPVPEVGADEIGELAGALEVFRQQALEVQRLNLVERLYGELSEAYQELAAMQERLVAHEKLAALGELVAGVAHEISNPLNFVKNFSEGAGELSTELFEMLEQYRDELGDADRELLDDIRGELSDSLQRVQANGLRALTIVTRMQSLGVVGGTPELTELHPVVSQAARIGCAAFASEWDDFKVEPEFEFSDAVDEAPVVVRDLNEAVVNLVTNACYALRAKRELSGDDGFTPRLLVSTRVDNGHAAISVWDNGTGIDDAALPQIFNPFFTTRDGALGAGLGLTLAADVARRGGGDLTVATESGAWTEFVLTVPLVLENVGVDALRQRLGGDVATVRRFGASSPSLGSGDGQSGG